MRRARVDLPMVMTKQTAAEELEVSVDTIQRLITRGDIPAITIGSSVRIKRNDLEDFIESRERW